MKRVTVKMPDGSQYRIDAPDDATAAKWLEAVFTAILMGWGGRYQDEFVVEIRA